MPPRAAGQSPAVPLERAERKDTTYYGEEKA